MSEQNTKIDGRTKRAADMALAKRTISRASYDALLAGRIGITEAKSIGRDGVPAADATDGPGTTTQISRSASAEGGQDGAATPPLPVSRISKNDRTPTKTPCLCGCGIPVPRTFAPGHDSRMFRVAREHLTEGRELTEEQREYLESSGKMERVRARLAQEDARRREAETRKTTRKGGR
jgi:hypothetical protein